MRAFLWSIVLGGCFVCACDGELNDTSTDSGQTDVQIGSCTPTTCEAQGKNCGVMPDGCGQTLSCGGCTAPDFCGGGGSANVCGTNTCTPTTCEATMRCGVVSDGCAGTLNCGMCGDGSTDANIPDANIPDANVPDAELDAQVGSADAQLDGALPDAQQGDV